MGKELVKYERESDLSQAGVAYRNNVDALKITSREKYSEMVALMLESKRYIKSVKDFYDNLRIKTKEAYDAVLADIRKYSMPFQDAERIAKQRISGWERVEADRKSKAEAKQAAIIAEAEAKQKAAEEEAKKNNAPPPVFAPPPIAAPVQNHAKVEGITFQDHWVGHVVNCKELCRSIAISKASVDFIRIEQGAINRFGQATKGKIAVPGIEWKNEKIVKGRA